MTDRITIVAKKSLVLMIPVLLFISSWGCSVTGEEQSSQPPEPEKIEEQLVVHGDTRVDLYYWMRDREDPKLLAYLEAENQYLEEVMAPVASLREELVEEMKNRIPQQEQSAPYYSNGFYYYHRYEPGEEYPIYCRKEGSLDADEQVILNVNELAEPYPYYNLAGFDVSLDNQRVAFTVDTLGRRQYTIMVKNLETEEISPTGIQYAGGDVVWAADHQTIFYNTLDPNTLRYEKVFAFNMSEGQEPREVYYEADETFYYMGVSRSKDDRFMMITTNSTLSTETWLLNADQPNGEFQVFQERTPDLLYHVFPYSGKFYVLTNLDAPNFRLMETQEGNTGSSAWQEVIGHRQEVLLENVELFDDYMVLQERSNALPQLRVIHMTSGREHYLDFQEEAYNASIGANARMSTNILRYNYTSLTTPMSYVDYNMDTREHTLVKQQEVEGDFDPANYQTERLMATARDGELVPLTLVYQKGIQKDGNNPLLLYGYGSYGNSAVPRFNPNLLSLLDRGFVYAIAHVRGGQDLGRQWYEEGKLLKKKNTFNDFIDCALFLVDQQYTNPEKLFASGGSAGGLLIGAVINDRPDLFKGVVANVPFVDVVTTMLDETIPLTTAEYDEWGNPNNKEYYEYILSYSPYDNVRELEYPHILVTSGLHDSQVQYWEPTKWVARLRDHNQSDNNILLYTNMEAGHGGASGRFQRLWQIAMQYAFLLHLE
ncbi:MAG: S9 family peptidase [Bacteroidales bacterium]